MNERPNLLVCMCWCLNWMILSHFCLLLFDQSSSYTLLTTWAHISLWCKVLPARKQTNVNGTQSPSLMCAFLFLRCGGSSGRQQGGGLQRHHLAWGVPWLRSATTWPGVSIGPTIFHWRHFLSVQCHLSYCVFSVISSDSTLSQWAVASGIYLYCGIACILKPYSSSNFIWVDIYAGLDVVFTHK